RPAAAGTAGRSPRTAAGRHASRGANTCSNYAILERVPGRRPGRIPAASQRAGRQRTTRPASGPARHLDQLGALTIFGATEFPNSDPAPGAPRRHENDYAALRPYDVAFFTEQ